MSWLLLALLLSLGFPFSGEGNNTHTNYTSNIVNQYTLIDSAVPTYDADGNMTASGNGWTYIYNGENRMVEPQFHQETGWGLYGDRKLRQNIKFNDDIEFINYHLYNFYLSVDPDAFEHNN